MKKLLLTLIILSLLSGLGYFLFERYGSFFLTGLEPVPAPAPVQTPPPAPPPAEKIAAPTPKPAAVNKKKKRKNKRKKNLKKRQKKRLERQFEQLMGKKNTAGSAIALPQAKKKSARKPAPRVPATQREKGIKEREQLPLGVVLWDRVTVYTDGQPRKAAFQMQTGDFVRVFPDKSNSEWVWVQPGVDLYLAATSKRYEIAGNRLPDEPGWVERANLHVFKPEQALEFTEKTNPITLGTDTDFSTLGFYERAMKNPDPVVHRVIGPRFMELLSIHEDYGASWGALIRDPDSKIRSVTLATLKRRGLGTSRTIIDLLLGRLIELTKERATGENKAEATAIIHLLGESDHSRVKSSFLGFWEVWPGIQHPDLLTALGQYVPKPAPPPPPEEKKKKKKEEEKKEEGE